MINKIMKNLKFKFVRSSGAGGQNVNKCNTKAIVSIHIKHLPINMKIEMLLNKSNYITTTCQETRHQYKNKCIAIDKIIDKIMYCLKIDKKRIYTNISKNQLKKIKKDKIYRKKKKLNRIKIDF